VKTGIQWLWFWIPASAGMTYKIKVLNPDGAMRGVKKMLVNGKVQPGNVVGVFKKDSVVKVEVRSEERRVGKECTG
jgi:hypothetical protein